MFMASAAPCYRKGTAPLDWGLTNLSVRQASRLDAPNIRIEAGVGKPEQVGYCAPLHQVPFHLLPTSRRSRVGISFANVSARSSGADADREVAMSKTIWGSIAVIFFGVLLIPLLVDTVSPSTLGAPRIAHRIAAVERDRGP